MLFEERAGVGEAEDEDGEVDGDAVGQSVLMDRDDCVGDGEESQDAGSGKKG